MFQMFAIMQKVWLNLWEERLIKEGRIEVLVKKNSTGIVTCEPV
jgi:hypothetical protein